MKANNFCNVLDGANPQYSRAMLHVRLLMVIALITALSAFAAGQGAGTEVLSSKSTTRFGIDKHFFDGSASYCLGDNILFYNATTGEGAVGKVALDGFRTTKTFAPGDFAPHWTNVSRVDRLNSLLFYNSNTGDAALGKLDQGTFATTKTYTSFSRGWSQIAYVGVNNNGALFYRASDGSGALGFDPTLKTYAKGAFAPDWTHIVWNDQGTLFYDTHSGSGAITIPVATGPGPFAVPNDIKTTRTFRPGEFTADWTHVAATRSGVLFYNYTNGSAAIGNLSSSNFVTKKSFAPGEFAAGWTHIVNGGGDLLLFYNSRTGEGAIGEMTGGAFRTTKTYSKDGFARGFTHVVCGADSPEPPH
jgi:hypothetical protein